MPNDFIILEIEEDLQNLIILGCPFLATDSAIIDVKRREILLEISENKVEFDVFKMAKQNITMGLCFRVDAIDSCVQATFKQ